MRTSRSRLITVLMLLVLALSSSAKAAEVLDGTLRGAYYKIVVPEDWNGILLVYARGYFTDVPSDSMIFDGLEDLWTSQGYALAGSLFRAGGWAVKEGTQDTLRVTGLFKDEFGKPEYTILIGSSMGAVIALKMIEKYHGIYDAAVSLCGLTAGTTEALDDGLALSLAYDAAWGWPESWGEVGDVRDDLTFAGAVAAATFPQLLLVDLGDPDAFSKFEFVRLASRNPQTGFYSSPGGFLTQLFFTTQGRAEIEQRAGGPVAQNLDHVYSLSASDQDYLVELGLDASTIDAWLAQMNATRIKARRSARRYAERYADFKGKLRRPVLTFHNEFDLLARVEHESAYHDMVAAQGKSALLTQVYNGEIGHCRFTSAQLSRVVDNMVHWLDTGQRPEGEAFFPTSEDFKPATYMPGPWPY